MSGISSDVSESLRISPNPTKGLLYISLPDANAASIELTDIAGKKLLEAYADHGIEKTLAIQSLPAGIYMLTIKSALYSITKKIVKD